MKYLNPKISIIVPVYNVESLLPKCIESILQQTYSNFELLLVDDGSVDSSSKVCFDYAEIDNRIRVFQKNNAGASSARNLGIDKCTGDLLCFIDSDDWIEKTYLSDFDFLNYEADLYIQGYKKYSENKKKIISEHFVSKNGFHDNLALFYIEIEKKHIINSACFKLYDRNIITDNSIRFDESISFGEDHLFSLQYFCRVSSICSSSTTGYIYFNSDRESLTSKHIKYDKMQYYVLNSYLLRNKIIEQHKIIDVNFSKFICQEFIRFYILSINSIFDKRSNLVEKNKLDLFNKSVNYIHSNKKLFSFHLTNPYFEFYRICLVSASPAKFQISFFLCKFYNYANLLRKQIKKITN